MSQIKNHLKLLTYFNNLKKKEVKSIFWIQSLPSILYEASSYQVSSFYFFCEEVESQFVWNGLTEIANLSKVLSAFPTFIKPDLTSILVNVQVYEMPTMLLCSCWLSHNRRRCCKTYTFSLTQLVNKYYISILVRFNGLVNRNGGHRS